MTDREKLIKLIENHCDYAGNVDCKGNCEHCLVDHLIANGVTFAADEDKSDLSAANLPKTVADKIRAKSDEELADEFVRFLAGTLEIIYEERPSQKAIDECQRLMLEQLRQPADSAEDKQHSGLIAED